MNNLFPISQDSSIEINSEPLSIRDKIDRLETEMFKAPQVVIETTHHFAKGLYAREIFIPKGVLLTGKIHKHEHLNIVSKGSIAVLTEGGIKRVDAPFTMVSLPGTKRVGYALEDTIWTTIHATSETDLAKLETDLIAKSHDDPVLTANEILILKGEVCPG